MSTIETTGWLSRMGESIKGVLFGILLVIGSAALLFKNEGCAVHTAKALAEGSKSVIEVKSDAVDGKNNGKLVAVQGEVTTKETLKDATFGATASALALRRTVEMYQRQMHSETKKKLGGGEETTYTCDDIAWSSTAVDVSKCKDVPKNPEMRWKADAFLASDATLGAFKVPSELVSRIDASEPLGATADTLKGAAADVASSATLSDGKIYVGRDPAKPAVGDVRVSFTTVKPTTVSIVAAQENGSLVPYKASNDEPIELLQVGTHSAAEMFKSAEEANGTRTWILRFGGWLLMAIGFFLIFRPLETIADVVPFIGSLLGAGLFVFACLLSAMFSSITIAIGWIFYRPLLGVALLVGGIGCGVLLAVVGKRKPRTA